MNELQTAMANVDQAEIDNAVDEVVRHGVAAAVADLPPAVVSREKTTQHDEEQRQQRNLDAMLADAVEVVSRQRARLGRRVCTVHDGATVRVIHEALRGMLAAGPNDQSFT